MKNGKPSFYRWQKNQRYFDLHSGDEACGTNSDDVPLFAKWHEVYKFYLPPGWGCLHFRPKG